MKFAALIFATIVAALATAAHAQNPEAVCRIQAGNSLGTGTVFFRDSRGDAYILTNNHVAGRRGARVAVEFWQAGALQPKRPGTVVESQNDGNYIDVAIVRVAADALADLDPPAIPLAPRESSLDKPQQITTRGCPGGTWPTQFVGQAIDANEKRVEFYPRPGGGRSGSAVTTRENPDAIAGLLTWSANKPSHENHGTDGYSPNSGKGIAQQVATIWAVIRGEVAFEQQDARPDSYVPLPQPLLDGAFAPESYQPLALQQLDPSTAEQETSPRFWPFRIFSRPQRPEPEKSPPMDQGPEQPPQEPSPPQEPAPEPEDPSDEWRNPQPSPDDQSNPDGFRDRRRGQPEAAPQPEPKPWFPRQESPPRWRPFARLVDLVKSIWNFGIYSLAAIGAFNVIRWFLGRGGNLVAIVRGTTPPAAVMLAGFLLAIQPAAAQDDQPPKAYALELEGIADKWAQQPAALLADHYLDYADAWQQCYADNRPLLVIVTLPGCRPCDELKKELERLDRDGFLNAARVAMIDASKEPELAAEVSLNVGSFPALVAQAYDEQTQKWTRTVHVGKFPAGGLDANDGTETLAEWLIRRGIK